MKKLFNHLDHFVWICRVENIEANVDRLSKLCRIKFLGPWDKDYGQGAVRIYVSWEGGLEVIAPLTEDSPYARHVRERGEGPFALVFAVDGLEEAKGHAESLGYTVSWPPLAEPLENQPWGHQLAHMEEIVVGEVMNTMMVFGDITLQDGVVRSE